MDVDISWLAVVLAAVSSMVVGMVWYARSLFGNAWISLAKLDKRVLEKANGTALIVAFISSLVMAYVLAHVTFLSHAYFDNSFLQDAVTTAFWMWLGFVGLRVLMHDAFEGRRKKLTMINAGNELVTIMIMGLIIGLMGN